MRAYSGLVLLSAVASGGMRARTGNPPGRRRGGMNVSVDELYQYHLGLLDKTGLSAKYNTQSSCMYRKVRIFLRQQIRKHGLRDKTIVLKHHSPTAYDGLIQLDVPRLLREGLWTWQAFCDAYLVN